MTIRPTQNSTDEIVSADVFEFEGRYSLNFVDKHGVFRVVFHGIPAPVAYATAKAFNDAMDAMKEEETE